MVSDGLFHRQNKGELNPQQKSTPRDAYSVRFKQSAVS
jgi:hypothetical protein